MKPKVTATNVGRTVVSWDSMGNPYHLEREGVQVPCVCDPEGSPPVVCVKHDMDPDAPFRKVGPVSL